MDCKWVKSKLVRYLDDDLPGPLSREISDHLDHCYLCSEEYRELLAVTELARAALQCPEHRDGYDRLRQQLRHGPIPAEVVYFPRRRVLRTVLTGTAVAAAMLLFIGAVGLPAVEAMRVVGAVVDAQAAGQGPVAGPGSARGHSLAAWGSQIRWAESLSYGFEKIVQESAPREEAIQEPLSNYLPSQPPAVILPPVWRTRVIVRA